MGRFSQRVLARASSLTAATAVILAALSMTTAVASAAPKANRYGVISSINGFSLFHSPQSQWTAQLSAMQQDGVQMVRSDAPWSNIEPTAPTVNGPVWQFGAIDAWVIALAQNHLTWEPVLDYNNTWANAATDNADFAAYAAAVAARYGPGGTFWLTHRNLPAEPVSIFELWNEENTTQWFLSPADYGTLYLAVHTAIHTVDPSASVDLGGLSDSGAYSQNNDGASWYLVDLFGSFPQLATVIDGYAIHPYGTTATDSAEWVVDFRHTLTHYGVAGSVPIDVTEFGWPYSSSSESWRAQQTNALGAAFSRSNCGLREAAPYDWINPSNDGMNDTDFGFVDPSASGTTLRPAGAAWFSAFAQGSGEATFVMC
jgi:hypothetical protein